MPTIDLVTLNAFMDSPVRRTMPQWLLCRTVDGSTFYENHIYRTTTTELTSLRNILSKTLADKIKPKGNAEVPLVRKIGTRQYYVYHPTSGKYLGNYTANLSKK